MNTYSIGRDLGCDIVINDNTDVVSRRHAVLNVGSAGKMTITDLSSNGTYVNGIKMAQGQAVPVTRKDTVSFAHVANLDWNMIPKPKPWPLYIVLGIIVIAAIAWLATKMLNDRPLPPQGDTPIAADTLGVVNDSVPTIDTIVADTTKMDTVKAVEKPNKKAKPQKQGGAAQPRLSNDWREIPQWTIMPP